MEEKNDAQFKNCSKIKSVKIKLKVLNDSFKHNPQY